MKNIRHPKRNGAFKVFIVLLSAGLLLPAIANAQKSSMEDRLRTQLQMTARQLQTLQAEQAQMQAARISAEAQRDTALNNIKQLEAELQRVQGKADTLISQKRKTQEQASESRQQADAIKRIYDDLLVLAQSREAERVALQESLTESNQALTTCAAKNDQMYTVGKEMLSAFEQVSTGSVLRFRQPFASIGRVKFEEMTQVFGDKLYSEQIRARDLSTTADHQ